MHTLNVETKDKSYPVIVGHGARTKLAAILGDLNPTQVAIMTDETVAPLHLSALRDSIPNVHVDTLVLSSGEKCKALSEWERAHTFLLERNYDRNSLILAFGGGAIGDCAGFVAATYMRGIRFIGVPTTVLAHDSAVGGKVAVNHALGKNMIGVFHQPEAVVYDLDFLETLPDAEWRSGFAELFKHAFISDAQFLHTLMREVTAIDALKRSDLTAWLTAGIEVKAGIVQEDTHEKGVRAYLNFGHTLAHAIENVSGYGVICHGEAVAVGISFALLLTERHYGVSTVRKAYDHWLASLGYPLARAQWDIDALIDAMFRDKKTLGGTLRFVLLPTIGHPELVALDQAFVRETLQDWQKGGDV
ncbi:MAG: 3-dehydroquinate synthase [Bacilli bacterium]